MKKLFLILAMALMYAGASAQTFNGLEMAKVLNGKIKIGTLSKKLVAEGFRKQTNNDGQIEFWSPDCCLTITPVGGGYLPEVMCYSEAAMNEIMAPVLANGYKCTDKLNREEWMYTKPNCVSFHMYIGPRGYFCIDMAPPGAWIER